MKSSEQLRGGALAYAAALLTVAIGACVEERPSDGPTPIERMLAQDSALEATAGDSANRHISFDYENLNRVVWQKPDLLVERLGDLTGKTVVEVGAGTGFFTRRLARRAGRVIALDIDPEMLLLLDSLNAAQLGAEAYARVDPRRVPPDDPGLADGEGDAALVVNTFMYIRDRADYLRRLARGLSPGSTVVIVDFKQKSTPVGPPVAARLSLHEVETALREAGLVGIRSDDTTLDYQYIVVARVP